MITSLQLTLNTYPENFGADSYFMSNSFSRPSGFTLLELLLSVALIGLLVGFSVPFYQSFKLKNDLSLATHTLAQSLREAQARAQAMEGDSPWGVRVEPQSITLFKGTSYAQRDPQEDITAELPLGMTSSGWNEVVFSKMKGYPSATGALTFTSAELYSAQVHLNEKGFISYQ